eukprot:SAG31_NODE_8165_length_1505_cov_551.359175_2_plen_147_part_00
MANYHEGEVVEVLQSETQGAGRVRVRTSFGWASVERFGTIQLERVRGEAGILTARADLERAELSRASDERRGVHRVAIVQLQADHQAEVAELQSQHAQAAEAIQVRTVTFSFWCRDFNREQYGTDRESVTMYRLNGARKPSRLRSG